MALEMRKTTCVMDCPDTCALDVRVHDGKVIQISGGTENPDTAGFICTKVSRFAQRLYHDDRLLYPLRRAGDKGSGTFTRISWDDAIGEIVARFSEVRDRWGGEAILPYHYGGSNGLLTDELIDHAFFARLGASRLAKTICAAPSGAVATGMYGKMAGVAFPDYPQAKCIIVWGANPKASNIHLVPYLRQAKENGAFIAVVDPMKNFSAREADLHLPIFPGSDLPVALAMIHFWAEQGLLDTAFLQNHTTGADKLLAAASTWNVAQAAEAARVPAQAIQELAERFAEATPAVIRCGWGVERNRNGGQALAAIMAIPALLGKFGVRGGGYTMSNSGAVPFKAASVTGDLRWQTRSINMTQLGQVLTGDLQPPIKAMIVYNCNPLATVPNQNLLLRGLARDDLFTVVFEQVMTDTAAYADILLPATTFLEHYDLRRGYGSYVIGGIAPVIRPLGEAKSNIEVFAALGRAFFGQVEPFNRSETELLAQISQNLPVENGPVNGTELAQGGVRPVKFAGENPVQFKTVFPRTGDGKANLAPACLGANPFSFEPVPVSKYPLALISPSTSKMISSTFGEFNYPELEMLIHPRDAARRRVANGDLVRVFNELGEVVCRARVSDRVRDGVVSMPKGAWRKSSANGMTSTALCPDTVNEVAGGACFNDARVEVEKAG